MAASLDTSVVAIAGRDGITMARVIGARASRAFEEKGFETANGTVYTCSIIGNLV